MPRAERREAIIAATADVLREGGPRHVTHRRVAEQAGVPLAATTYYFASKSELLAEALTRAAGAEIARLEALADQLDALVSAGGDPVEQTAALLAAGLASERDSAQVKFEVYLEAARRPELRAACAGWLAAFRALAERALAHAGAPLEAAPLFVAGIDGLFLAALATGRPGPDAAAIEGLLRPLAGVHRR